MRYEVSPEQKAAVQSDQSLEGSWLLYITNSPLVQVIFQSSPFDRGLGVPTGCAFSTCSWSGPVLTSTTMLEKFWFCNVTESGKQETATKHNIRVSLV